MKQKWKIEITDEQKLWLESCYENLKQNNPRVVREMKVRLYPNISATFSPNSIDKRLLVGGAAITLLGILYVDPNSDWLQKAETLLKAIKKTIVQNPTLEKVEVETLIQKVNMDRQLVLNLMNTVSHYGRFWNGHSSDQQGLKSLSIDSDEVFEAYLKFENIEELIDVQFMDRPNDYNSLDLEAALVHQTESDFKPNPIFRSKVQKVDKKLAFVLMPFAEVWSDLVWKKIKEAVENMDIQCLRADSLYGLIVIEDIWVKINQCAFIIADVTNTNPNVMYEMGIVHAVGKPSILLSQEKDKIPFDFRHLRHFFYKYSNEKVTELEENLQNAIRNIYKEDYNNEIQFT